MSWGLVLSGGAAFGLANGGVLDVLDREGFRPDYVGGSSMGAIIGAMYAMDIPVATMRECVRAIRPTNVARMTARPFHHGLHGGLLQQSLERHLGPLLGDTRIADTRIPFICVAGRVREPIRWLHILKKGFTEEILANVDLHVFSPETKLLDAVMASSAIPVVFSPVEIDGAQYVDLCHFGPIPARTLKDHFHPDVIVATDTYPSYEKLRGFLPGGWNAFLQAGYREIEKSKAVCDLIIKPEMPFALFRFDKGEAFWTAGMRAAEEKLPEIRRILI